jgi:futalosine hydrolase
MKILIVSATEFEIAPFLKQKGNIDILITGIGLPMALYHLQKKINENPYDLVIQAGIAGAFTNEFELGETVLVKQDIFGDIGMEENSIFTPIFETELFNKNEFSFEDGWLINKNKTLQQSNLELVKAITVNKVTDNKKAIEQLATIFNAEIETMEGAALHYVCLQQNISFIQIRSISNYVGERDKTKWKMNLAIENLNLELIKLINGLTN